jgi:hypothetical protein
MENKKLPVAATGSQGGRDKLSFRTVLIDIIIDNR